MADSVATAFVDIRPNLVGFEAELAAGLAKATRGINPAGLTKAATGQAALGAATRSTTRALSEQATVMQIESTQLARFSRGVAATGLAQVGLRGATLAATSAFLAGAAAITALSKAIGTATQFNSQLAVFAATTGATATEMERVSDAAKALGRDLSLPGVSASDAAVAMTELAKAGLSVGDAIAGARGVLQLAIAANIDFAQATELAASAINAFGLSGDKAVVVADTLANAANAAQGSIVDVGIAFQQAASIGHQVGLTFQDTTLFVTELARAGLTGSDAGTSLRTALVRLINPTKKAAEIFHDLGIEVRDAQGNVRPEFFTNLGIALKGMSKAQRDATLAQIGGQDAVRALSILSRASAKDVLRLRDELATQGTAEEVAAARMVGLAGAGQNLQNTIEGIALTLGQKATPALISTTNSLTAFITSAAQSPAIGVLGESISAIADSIGSLTRALGTASPIVSGFINLLAGAVGAVGPGAILASVGAYIALAGAFSKATLGLRLFVAELATSIVLGGTLRATLQVLAAGVLSLATSTTGIAVLAGALFFLSQREDSLEKATRKLAAATRDLDSAFREASSAADGLARAQSSLKTDKIAVDAAKLAAVQAGNDLRNSTAAAKSFERAQLENRLAFALDAVRLAEEQVAADHRAVAEAQKTATQAGLNRKDALNAERDSLLSLIAAERERGSIFSSNPEKAEAFAIAEVIAKLREKAAEERKSNTDEGRAVAKRLDALAQLAGKVQNLPTTVRLVLDTADFDTGLRNAAQIARVQGDVTGANFIEGLRIQMNPQNILSPLGNLGPLFAQLGKSHGSSYGSSFAATAGAIVNAALNAMTNAARVAAVAAAGRLSNQVDSLLQNVTRIQAEGGTVQEQLAAAREAADRAAAFLKQADNAVKAAHGARGAEAAAKAQAKAISDLASARGTVTSLEGQIAAEAKAGASATAKEAKSAQQALDEADQAFLAALGLKRGALDIRVSRAELTAGLKDDISIQRIIQKSLRAEIAETARTIHDATLREQTIQSLTQALLQSQKSVQEMLKQITDNAKQHRQELLDRRRESLELDVQIAETKKNSRQELKAHQALLKYLEQRRAHTSKGSVEWKRLTADIERERAAIDELRKAQKSKQDSLKQAEFDFLTTQTGFVANLLGNLLPVGAVAGTVGGGGANSTGGGTPGGANDFPFTDAKGRGIDNGLGEKAQTSTGPRGVSAGQMAVLIAITREMLSALRGGGSRNVHPEAANQRAWVWSSTDITGGWG